LTLMANGPLVGSRSGTRSLERAVRRLASEVKVLRGGLISILGEDPEGAYQPHFVEETLRAAQERPSSVFRGAAVFARALRRRAWRSSTTRTS